MKKRRLKIKLCLFISLVIILGTLLSLYAVFCRGKSYNKAEIPTQTTTEAPTEEPTTEEITTEPITEALPEDITESATETTTEPPMAWANYSAMENLAGENWALTIISSRFPIDKTYTPSLSPVIDNSLVTADSRVSEAYKKMYTQALAEGFVLTPYSGYCSFSRQQENYMNKIDSFMLQGMTREEATANAEKRVPKPGMSENNAGLAVDIISASTGFASTKEYKWLTENAHKYGFVLRYPQDKTELTGMIYQPWHWRYVGTEAATEMKNSNQCLEEYLKVQ